MASTATQMRCHAVASLSPQTKYSSLSSRNAITSSKTLKISQTNFIQKSRRTAISQHHIIPRASLTIKEGGVEFPLVQKFWLGEDSRVMGAGVRTKKIAFIGVKVYVVAFYVEAAKAAHELGVRDRGGFFENDDDFCSALVDGGFIKSLQIELVRDVEGATFVEALNDALKPRMQLIGEMSTLDKLRVFFEEKKLTKGTNIVLMYRTDATLDVAVKPSRPSEWTNMVADLSIASPSLCRGLFEVFLGENSVVPEARKEWANGARALLESEKVRRDTRKGGSG